MTTSPAPPTPPKREPSADERFVGYLLKLDQRTDGEARRRLAELRRAGLEGGRARALSVVGDRIPQGVHRDDLWAYLLTAELVALCAAGGRAIGHFDAAAHKVRRTSLGASARAVNERRKSKEGDLVDESPGIAARFGAVLALPAEDLPDELRRLMRLLHQKGAPFDFFRLLPDLLVWERLDQPTQTTWARHYWSAPASSSDPA